MHIFLMWKDWGLLNVGFLVPRVFKKSAILAKKWFYRIANGFRIRAVLYNEQCI